MKGDLYLIGNNGFTAKIHKEMVIGRDWCRIFGDVYKYVSTEQFKIEKGEEEWKIHGIASAVNPTLLNEENISGKHSRLENESLIRIGKLLLKVKVVTKFSDVVPKAGQAKRIAYSWDDHFGKNWRWNYDLQKKIVRDAEREYGLSVKNYDEPYLDRKGFQTKNGIFFTDYSKIARRNLVRMKEVAGSLASLAESLYAGDKYRLLSFILSFVQSIPYSVPPEQEGKREIYGFFTPPEVLYWGFGDCDSKSVLLATLWKNIFSDPIVILRLQDVRHVMVAFSNIEIIKNVPFYPMTFFESDRIKYLLCEAAGPGLFPPGTGTEFWERSRSREIYDF